MSVYHPKDRQGRPKSPFWYYDFQIKGRRFHGSTGRTSRSAALQAESKVRRAAQAEMKGLQSESSLPMTVEFAFARHWRERGSLSSTSKETRRVMDKLMALLGPKTEIRRITTSMIAELVCVRREAGYRRCRRGGRIERLPVSNATINRTVIEPLRRVLRRARDVWGEQIAPIDWSALVLREPQERVREASIDEENAIMAAMRDDYAPALEFAFLTGCRLNEIVTLSWDRVKWHEEVIEVVGKGKRRRRIPMLPEVRLLLWPLQGHHETAVFTYVAQRPNKKRGISRGQRVPLTIPGLKTRWRRDRAQTKVRDFRFHDTRHTVATRVLRATGNLRVAQKLLGHSDVSTTARYAHASLDDVRDGLWRVHEAKRQITGQQGPSSPESSLPDDLTTSDGDSLFR